MRLTKRLLRRSIGLSTVSCPECPTCQSRELIAIDIVLPEWTSIPLQSALKRALLALGFVKPTEIQARSLQHGLDNRDLVGVAETVRLNMDRSACGTDICGRAQGKRWPTPCPSCPTSCNLHLPLPRLDVHSLP